MKTRRYLLIAGIVLAMGTGIAAFAFAWKSGERFDVPYVYNVLSPLIAKDVEPERRWAEYAGGLELALTRVSSIWLLLD